MVIKRKQLVQEQQIQDNKQLRYINGGINEIIKEIGSIEKQINIKHCEIRDLERARKTCEQKIKKLEKSKCQFVGHEWDYDWERHDEGGGLFEHCVICGAPRMD